MGTRHTAATLQGPSLTLRQSRADLRGFKSHPLSRAQGRSTQATLSKQACEHRQAAWKSTIWLCVGLQANGGSSHRDQPRRYRQSCYPPLSPSLEFGHMGQGAVNTSASFAKFQTVAPAPVSSFSGEDTYPTFPQIHRLGLQQQMGDGDPRSRPKPDECSRGRLPICKRLSTASRSAGHHTSHRVLDIRAPLS